MTPYRYEAVFYSALALALLAWILFENAILCTSKVNRSPTSINAMEDNIIVSHDDRHLQLSDMRIPLAFVSYSVVHFLVYSWLNLNVFEIVACALHVSVRVHMHQKRNKG